MGAAVSLAIFLVVVAALLIQSNSGGGSGDSSAGTGAVGATVSSTTPLNARVQALASAIATAEGFGVPGAVPTRANNPGDLVRGDKGHGVANSEGVTIYQDAATGWSALYFELNLIFTGRSKVYSPSMTFAEFAQKWTGGDSSNSWASNVTQIIGANVSDALGDWFNS